MEEFLQEKFGILWKPDQIRIAMDIAVDEYHESCERYDKTVCARRWDDGTAMPETAEQWRFIHRNARESRKYLLCRVSREFALTPKSAEDYWREAMRLRRPIR